MKRAGQFDEWRQLITDTKVGEVVASYKHIISGMRVDLVYNCFGTLYRLFRSVGRIGFCQSIHNSDWVWLEALTSDGKIQWLKTPGGLYHCWHVCMCPQCTTGEPSEGGRVHDHSQGTWNEHLKKVKPMDVFTFPTLEKKV